MPTYEYRCQHHGYFTYHQSIKFHAFGPCPECGAEVKQILTSPPGLDQESMADVGMPGALEVCGDRLEKRHIQAGQSYVHPDKARKYHK